MVAINSFLTPYTENGAVLNPTDYAWTQQFREHWVEIRDEFRRYAERHRIPAYKDINECASMRTEGWKALFLRIFDTDTEMMAEFPVTRRLINACPCTTAYFSKLEPGTRIPPHYGIYKGVIRYHLGISIPTDWEQCFLKIDGQILNWREGHDLMFDDLFEHSVENNTDEERVILFLDIKRDFGTTWVNVLNTILMSMIRSNPTLQATVSAANIQNKQVSDYRTLANS